MPDEVTYTDLRRLLFMVEAVRQSLSTGDPYKAVSDVYRGDEHLVAEYDEDGVIRPSFIEQEYRRALATLGALAGPRPEDDHGNGQEGETPAHKLEAAYRDWWRNHTPAERAALQRLDGQVSPRQVLDVVEDPDGMPLAVDMVDNPYHGTVSLPSFLLSWDPNDDDPQTVEEDKA